MLIDMLVVQSITLTLCPMSELAGLCHFPEIAFAVPCDVILGQTLGYALSLIFFKKSTYRPLSLTRIWPKSPLTRIRAPFCLPESTSIGGACCFARLLSNVEHR